MADPTGTNLTAAQVSRAELADPRDYEFKLTSRLQALRVDMDAMPSAGAAVSFSSVTAPTGVKLVLESDDAVEVKSDGVECIKGMGIGGAAAVGFYGATPVLRAAHIATPTDEASNVVAITAILAVLENLGLTATS